MDQLKDLSDERLIVGCIYCGAENETRELLVNSICDGFVCILYDWQTLIGAILGGVIALLAALIVAHTQTRRERRAAAALVLADLLAVQAVAQNLGALATEDAIPDDQYPRWVAEKLAWHRPQLSTLFEAEMARLIDIHVSLSAHLSLFKTIYSSINERIERLEQDQQQLRRRGVPAAPRAPQARDADARSVAHALDLSSAHAKYAEHYLGALVLAPFPTFVRLRMMVWPRSIENESKQLLQKGHLT